MSCATDLSHRSSPGLIYLTACLYLRYKSIIYRSRHLAQTCLIAVRVFLPSCSRGRAYLSLSRAHTSNDVRFLWSVGQDSRMTLLRPSRTTHSFCRVRAVINKKKSQYSKIKLSTHIGHLGIPREDDDCFNVQVIVTGRTSQLHAQFANRVSVSKLGKRKETVDLRSGSQSYSVAAIR